MKLRRHGIIRVSYKRLHSLLELPPDLEILNIVPGGTGMSFEVITKHPAFERVASFCLPYCYGQFGDNPDDDWVEDPLLGFMEKEGE